MTSHRLSKFLEVSLKIVPGVIVCMALLGCVGKVGSNERSLVRMSIPTHALVLRVEVKNVEATDWFDPSQCEAVSECIPQFFWYSYRARVIENFSGKWPKPEIFFAHSQHAKFDRKRTNDCYVVLVKANDLEAKINVDFIASGVYSNREWRYDVETGSLVERPNSKSN